MDALTWLVVIIISVIGLIIAYYAFFVIVKIAITLLPAIAFVTIGGLIGLAIGGALGGIIFFISIIGAFKIHSKWEGSDLYHKIELWFDKKTTI